MSDMNYLKDVQVHQFADPMSITECAFETIMAIEEEWSVVEESVDINDMSLFEAELLGLAEAEDEAKGNFKEKLVNLGKAIIAMLKKIAAYIMGMVSKFLIALNNFIKKNSGYTKDKARCERGAERIKAEDKSIKLYGVLCTASDKAIKPNAVQAYLDSEFGFSDPNKVLAASAEELNSKLGEYADTLRGKFVGEDSVDAKSFKDVIMEKMTGEKSMKEYVFDKNNIVDSLKSAIYAVNNGNEHKKEVKRTYDEIKEVINKQIKEITSLSSTARKFEDSEKKNSALAAIKAAGKVYKTAGTVFSAGESAVINVLSADYRMNASLVVKCYIAGGSDAKAKRDAKAAFKDLPKEEEVKQEAAEVETTQESVESIFGLDLI